MVPFERAMVVSYRLSIVTVALYLTIRPQFAIECRRRSNQFGAKLGRKGSTDVYVSQISTRSGRDGAVVCKRNSLESAGYLLPLSICTNVDVVTDKQYQSMSLTFNSLSQSHHSI